MISRSRQKEITSRLISFFSAVAIVLIVVTSELLAATVEINSKNKSKFAFVERSKKDRVYCRLRANRDPIPGLAQRISRGKQRWESYSSKIKTVQKSKRLSRAKKKKQLARLRKARDKYTVICRDLVTVTPAPTQTSSPSPTPTQPPPAQLLLAPTALSFGSLVSGEASPIQELTISNVGSTPFSISSIRPGGADSARFSVLYRGTTVLAPGQSIAVPVVFSAEGEGLKQGTIEVLSDQSATPATVAVSGTVLARAASPAFSQTGSIPNPSEEDFSPPTQMAWGPDGRLYVASFLGQIVAYTLNEDYTVANKQIFPGVAGVPNRNILGLAFNPKDPPSPVRIYVAHSELYQQSSGNECADEAVTYSGQVSLLTGPDFDTVTPVVTGLPVSNHDMGINGIEFDDFGDLFIAAGGMTNAGVPDCMVGGLPEKPLSAAILKAPLTKPNFNGVVQHLDSTSGLPDTDARNGNVDVAPGSDVSLFSVGHRNTFDLTWTTRSNLYSTDNGPGAAFGPASTSATTEMPIPSTDDEVLLCSEGSYYGHPNRNRGRFDDRQNIYRGPSETHQSGIYAAFLAFIGGSSNGITEYRSRTFNSAMRGNLIVKRFSFSGAGDLYSVALSPDGRQSTDVLNLDNTFSGVDVIEGPDGALVISDLRQDSPNTSAIRILSPVDTPPNGVHVRSIVPWRAPAGGGTPFIIGGTSFVAGSTVTIGGQAATIMSITPNRISGIIPAAVEPSADLLDVVVRSGTTASVLSKAFRYLLDDGQGIGAWESETQSSLPLGEGSGGFIKGLAYSVSTDSPALRAFDPVSGEWSEFAARPFVGSGHGSVAFDNKLYVFGGIGGNSEDKVQVYDPVTNTWSTAAPMPFPGGRTSVAVIGSQIFVAGGLNGSTVRSELAIFDPVANTWAASAPMPSARFDAAGGSDGSALYIFGGRSSAGGPETATVFRFDPAAGTWLSSDSGALPAMPVARAASGNAPLYRNELYLIGGQAQPSVSVLAFDPSSNSWRSEASLPSARSGLVSLLFNLKIYVFGGVLPNATSSSAVEVFHR